MNYSRAVSLLTLLFAAFLCLLAPSAGAELIQTDEALAESQSQAQTDREKVRAFVDRATVTERLKALGVQEGLLKPRVDALTDDEAHMLAQRIDALPAGGALTDFQVILIVILAAILVAVIVS